MLRYTYIASLVISKYTVLPCVNLYNITWIMWYFIYIYIYILYIHTQIYALAMCVCVCVCTYKNTITGFVCVYISL